MIPVPPTSEGAGITIRPWAARDAAAVDALLSSERGDDPTARLLFAAHGAARDGSGAFRRTLVAEIDRQIVAAATVWEYWLHPARWRLAVHVRPEYRRRGIGGVLFRRLLAAVASRGPRPWQAATSADDGAGLGFLARHGFRSLMRTKLGELDPAALGRTAWGELEAAAAAVTEAGYRIVALPELPADLPLRPSLASLHAEVYRQTHRWNPPAELSEEDAEHLFLGDDLIPGSLFVALAGDRPVGVASLRLGPSPGDRELGWIGVDGGHRDRAAPLTAGLLGRCLAQARAHRRRVRLEIDEANRHLWRLVEGLAVPWEPDWLTHARAAPSRPPSGE